jgi:hypothetical protein
VREAVSPLRNDGKVSSRSAEAPDEELNLKNKNSENPAPSFLQSLGADG